MEGHNTYASTFWERLHSTDFFYPNNRIAGQAGTTEFSLVQLWKPLSGWKFQISDFSFLTLEYLYVHSENICTHILKLETLLNKGLTNFM